MMRSLIGPRAATQPTRRPGPTTFDSDPAWITWAGASSRIDRPRSPSRRVSAYTWSSSTKKLRSSASSASRRPRAAERSRPVGL